MTCVTKSGQKYSEVLIYLFSKMYLYLVERRQPVAWKHGGKHGKLPQAINTGTKHDMTSSPMHALVNVGLESIQTWQYRKHHEELLLDKIYGTANNNEDQRNTHMHRYNLTRYKFSKSKILCCCRLILRNSSNETFSLCVFQYITWYIHFPYIIWIFMSWSSNSISKYCLHCVLGHRGLQGRTSPLATH